MRLLSLFLSIVFLFSAVPAGADFEIKNWRYEKTIQLPRLSRTGLVELSFDEEVFANASQGLRDVRIIDSNGQETPYKLVVERKKAERASLTGRVLDKSFIPGEYSFFVIDLGQAGLFHNQVDIRSSSLNFRREAIVEASNDAETWSVVNRKAIIYDYTDAEAGLKARNTRIKYPESTKRYLRIKVINKDEEPLNISGAAVFYEKATLATAVSYSAIIIEQSIDEERRASRLVLDLGSSGLPNNSLSIQTSSSNFQRDMGIEGSNDKEKWNIVKSRDVIFAFRTPKFTGSKFNVGYPENTYRYLRLTIFNRDNPPLNIQGVNVSGLLQLYLSCSWSTPQLPLLLDFFFHCHDLLLGIKHGGLHDFQHLKGFHFPGFLLKLYSNVLAALPIIPFVCRGQCQFNGLKDLFFRYPFIFGNLRDGRGESF